MAGYALSFAHTIGKLLPCIPFHYCHRVQPIKYILGNLYCPIAQDDQTGTGSCDGLSELSSSQSLSSGPGSEISSGGSTSAESRASKLERVVKHLHLLKMAVPESTEKKPLTSQSHAPVQTETKVESNFERMKAYLDRQKVQKGKQAAMSTKNESDKAEGSKQIPNTSGKNPFVLPSSVS